MSKKRKYTKKEIRSDPQPKDTAVVHWLLSDDYNDLCSSGYTRLADNAEVNMCVDKIANLISSMTIRLMKNETNGDIRLKNELSKKIDINPNQYMTRKNFIFHLVKTMFLWGDGNCVAKVKTNSDKEKNYIENIVFFDMNKVRYSFNYENYKVIYENKVYDPSEILHFVLNPSEECPFIGSSYKKMIMEIINNLKQATKTKKGFMGNKYLPSLIVNVDALIDEFSSKEGREKLLEKYMESSEQGRPWIVPAGSITVEQVKPLTLNDLAINDSVKLDKETVAAIFDVPPFIVGIGNFDKNTYNNFISSRVMPIAQSIQQELTKKILYADDMYFSFNPMSIYSYDLIELGDFAKEWRANGLIDGNEARNIVGLSPREGLDELVILENYIPTSKTGKQKKLKDEGGDNDGKK